MSKEFFCDDLIARIEEERRMILMFFVVIKLFFTHPELSKNNVHIKESEDPNSTLECVQNSPRVNVFCALLKKVYAPIFFTEPANANIIYLNTLEMWL